jgi:hypothetical protein
MTGGHLMKTKPTRTRESEPAYPTRRDFIQRIGMVAVGAGLGVLALPPAQANDLRGNPKMPKAGPSKDKAKTAFCAKTCGKEIDAQIKLLGNDSFKIRTQATAKLIAIGKAEGEEKKVAEQKCALVVARMKLLKKAKDPEVAQRAKSIIVALTPPKPPPPPPIRHRGKVAIRR